MARPLTAAAFLAALRAEGVVLCADCCDSSSWKTHRRAAWAADVVGIVNHHTASNNTPTGLIRDGRPDLRGPLSQTHMTRDGVIHLVGYGWCNHAGLLDADVLEAMSEGRPAPAPRKDDLNGNPRTYNIEINGTDDGQPFTAAMVDNLVRYNTAICRAHDWNAYHVIGHREGTRRKPSDPAGIGMPKLRGLVTARLATTPITPAPLLEDEMFTLIETTDSKRLYAISGSKVIHLDWEQFLSFVGLRLFSNTLDAAGNHVTNKGTQAQVDRVIAALA